MLKGLILLALLGVVSACITLTTLLLGYSMVVAFIANLVVGGILGFVVPDVSAND